MHLDGKAVNQETTQKTGRREKETVAIKPVTFFKTQKKNIDNYINTTKKWFFDMNRFP